MQQLSQLDYEAIENAVMETVRGRWFLSEYKKRHTGTSTSSLLDAISRLEKVVTTLGDGSYQAVSPEKVIAPAAEISEVVPAVPENPTANEPTKKFVAPTPFFSGGKDSKTESTSEPTPLNDENLKFFSNDEDLFSDDANDLLPDASGQNFESPDLANADAESPKVDLSFAETKIEDKKPAPVIAEPALESVKEESTLDAEVAEVSDRFKIFRTDTSNEIGNEASPETGTETASTETEQDAAEPVLDELFGDSAPALEEVNETEIETQEVQAPVIVNEDVVSDPIVSNPVVSNPVVSNPVVPDPAIQATDEEKDRIVIIRGNSDNNIDIPFADDIFGDNPDKPIAS